MPDHGSGERNAARARRRKAPPNCEWRGDTLHGRKRIKGTLHRWTLSTSDVDVARERVKEGIARLERAAFGGGRVPYADIAASWAETHIVHEVGPRTARRYAVSLRQLEPILLPLFFDEIDKAKIKEIVTARRGQGVTTATIRRDLSALSSVFIFADTGDNPALDALKKLTEKRDPIVLPEPAHIERVLARSPAGLAALARAAWLTGCRQEELAAAERAKLDHGRRQLTVLGKGNKWRTIDLSAEAYDHLRSLPVHLRCKWLFWHPVKHSDGKVTGEPYRNVASRFSSIVRAELVAAYDTFHGTGAKTRPALKHILIEQDSRDWCDIGFRTFTFHHLRHRFAVDWLKSGRSIYDLKDHLGHESIKTTEIYLKFLTAEEKRIAKYGASVAAAVVEQRGA